MKKIVIGGVLYKKEIFDLIQEICPNKYQVEIKQDLEAVFEIKNGVADYYIGACNTGGGGALAMAIGILGPEKCSAIATPAGIKDSNFIEQEVKAGKIAFGFTTQATQMVLPVLLNILEQGE